MSAPRVRKTRGGGIERWFREPHEVLAGLRLLDAVELARGAAEGSGVELLAALGASRGTAAAVARQYVVADVAEAYQLSIRRAASLFGLDRSTVRAALRSVARRRGLHLSQRTAS